MARLRLLIIVILGVFNVCEAQSTSPFSQEQLLAFQKYTQKQISDYLTQQGWQVEKLQRNQLPDYFNYSLGYRVDRWDPPQKRDWQGSLFVYYQKGFPNLIVYQTTKQIFLNLKPTYTESIKDKNLEITILIRYGAAIEFRNYLNLNTRRKYSILCYDIGSVKELISIEKRKAEASQMAKKVNEEKKIPVDLEKIKNYQTNLTMGNQEFDQNKFDQALYHYEMAKAFLTPEDQKELADLETRISICKKAKTNDSYQQFKTYGDTLFNQKKYSEALKNYKKAFVLNQKEKYIGDRIACLEKALHISRSADSVQNYRIINPEGYSDFQKLNIRILNSITSSAKEDGFLNYTFKIKFDQQGKNESDFKINSISNDQWMFYLNDISVAFLTPSQIYLSCLSKKIFIPTQDLSTYNLNWQIRVLRAKVKDKVITSSMDSLTPNNRDSIKVFINRHAEDGLYTFKVKDKNLNGRKYQDISLIDYKHPFDGSMFMPGLSNLQSSDGQKGKGTMVAFLFSTAFSIGSKIYSDQQYKKYKDPLNEANRNKYYNNANLAHKLFLISGGVAVSIYLYDLTSFIIRKPAKHRSLLSDLKNGPIPVTESSFEP